MVEMLIVTGLVILLIMPFGFFFLLGAWQIYKEKKWWFQDDEDQQDRLHH